MARPGGPRPRRLLKPRRCLGAGSPLRPNGGLVAQGPVPVCWRDVYIKTAHSQRIGPATDVRVAITALVGIRRNLFPAAPAALEPIASGALS